MASQYYVGIVAAVAEVDTFTPASPTTGDVNTLTVKNEYAVTITTVSFTVGTTQTAAAVVTGLTAAWNANLIASPLAAASGSATFILTANPAGRPLHVTSAVTGTGTLTKATTISSSGPSDWSQAGNWSLGSVPVSSDSVYLECADAGGGFVWPESIRRDADESLCGFSAVWTLAKWAFLSKSAQPTL